MLRLPLLCSICYAAMAADVKPLVPNGTGGWMPVQTGQTIFCPLTSGAFSAIPAAAAGNVAQVYWATDTQTLYRSNGSTWIALATAATPGGSAGGDLGATYPNPTVQGLKGLAVPSVVTGAFLKLNGSGAWEFVSYGSGADQPAAGNDSRFTNARAPTGAATGDLAGTYPAPTVAGILGLSLPGVVNNSFPKITSGGAWEWVTYGSGPDTPVAGNDSRLSNARAPTGAASGDLSGTYPGPVVLGWNGAPLGTTTPTAGNLMIGSGSQWSSHVISGDVSLAAGGAATLASTGTPGTYTVLTTDAKGRVTSGSSPSTLAGLGITNGVQNYGGSPGILTGILSARPSASIAGRIYVSTDTTAIYEDTGSAWTLLQPVLTGDVTTSGAAATLAASGVTLGTYGGATLSPQITVDAKGRVTSAANVTIAPAAGSLTGIVGLANGGSGADLSATGGSGRVVKQTITGAAFSVAALLNADLPISGVTGGTYKSVTVDTHGIVTAATNPTTLSGFGITDAVQNGGGAPVMFTGADSAKPTAGTAGRLYFANDTGKIYIDSGSMWNLELPTFSGDVTNAGTVNTLAATGVSSGTYGTATQVPTITLDAKGRATVASQTTIALPASQITSGALAVARGGTATSSWTDGQVLIGRTSDGSAVPATITAGTGISVTNAGGTITIGANAGNQSANTVYAGPTSGAAAAPTFRALVAADIPGLPASQITSGQLSAANGGTGFNGATAGNGVLPIGNGSGFSPTTLTAGSGITVTNGAGTITIAASGGSGVTSVAQTVPAFLSISGSPITTSGTLALGLSGAALPLTSGGTGLNTTTAYAVFAGGTTSTGNFQQVSGLGTSGQVLTSNGAGALPTWQSGGGGSGTVTSVAMSVPSFLSVSGSPVTTSGTLAVTLSGTALPVINGGTGVTSATAYSLIAGGTTGTGAFQSISGLGTSGQVLTSNGAGALPTWQSGGGGSIGGSIASTQIAVGSGTNTIGGSSGLTYSSDSLFLASASANATFRAQSGGSSLYGIYEWDEASTRCFQEYGNTTTLTWYDIINTQAWMSYTPGAIGASVFHFYGTKDASSLVAASVIMDGGLSVTKSAQIGASLIVNTNTTVTNGQISMIETSGSATLNINNVANRNDIEFTNGAAGGHPGFSIGTGVPGATVNGDMNLCFLNGGNTWTSMIRGGYNTSGRVLVGGATDDTINSLQVSGAMRANNLVVPETGGSAYQGKATLVAGVATVTTTVVTTHARIFLTVQSLGTVTTPKAIAVTAQVANTSFTITSADLTDTSVVAWEIFYDQ